MKDLRQLQKELGRELTVAELIEQGYTTKLKVRLAFFKLRLRIAAAWFLDVKGGWWILVVIGFLLGLLMKALFTIKS